jgi:SAM-dependent methyltransferase
MNESPPFRTVRASGIQNKLDEQAELYREQLGQSRREVNAMLDRVLQLRRNPLARPFVDGTLVEQVRKVKKLLSADVRPPVKPGAAETALLPRAFAFSGSELAAMTEEQRGLVGRMAADLIGRNLDIPYDPQIGVLSAGFISRDAFIYVGVEWLEMMIRHCALAPEHAVLDIGCGCGRMAGPLSMYLNEQGKFYGFDPIKKSIDYALKHLRQSNFQFEFVDLSHYLYNPGGTIDPTTYRFPCPDAAIHVSLAASIFTHLDIDTANHYLRETFRVLRPGGRAFYSLFAMKDEMKAPEGGVTKLFGPGNDAGSFRFLNRGQGHYTHCDENGKPKNHYMPDSIGDPVAWDYEVFIAMAAAAGLTVQDYLPGGWCGREYRHGYQDIFVLRKPE